VVPNVVGRSLRIAKIRIIRAHCKVGTITRKTSSLARKGRVLGEVPRAGRKLKNGAKVNLIVGRGPTR
jgi:beta-lactam-binding protein with PASTA domain